MTQIAEKPSVKELDRGQRIDLLRQMMLIRRFEEKAAEMYARRKIAGFLHLYIGEEAIAAGAIGAINDDDPIMTHYRDHGHALARGLEPGAIMAELFGKDAGVSRGKGGSMHLFDTSRHFLGGYAIVGGHLPLACGLALAQQRLNTGKVVLCIFGDGAVNQGEFHEAMNLAAVWQLPIVFLCENNFYGMGTDIRRVSAVIEVYKRVTDSYAMFAEQVNGMDVLEMYEATQRAARHARSGKGPYFLEAITYRFRGHSMADPELYREKSELKQWRKLDPIATFRQHLEDEHNFDEDQYKRLEDDIEDIINEAVKFADESPKPSLDALSEHVYWEEES